MKKILSLFIVITMLISLSVPAFAEDMSITRGDAGDMIYEIAKRYNPDIVRDKMMVGDSNGNLRLNDPITYSEVVVLLERAFGTVPEAVGNNKRLSDPDASYADTPQWAEGAYEAMLSGGVLSGQHDAKAPADKQELTLILQRITRLYGNNPKDDFYESVNKEWLDTAVFPEGQSSNDSFSEINEKVVAEIEVILDELVVGSYPSSTPEYYVSKFIQNALNREKRNADGFDPIKKYLDAIDSISTIDDLVRVHAEILEGTGYSPMYGFSFDTDIRDSSQKTLYFGGASIHLSKDDLDSDNSLMIDAFADSVAKLLTLVGETEAEAKTDQLIAFEKELSSVMLKPQELHDVELAYEESTLAELDALFETVDMTAIAEASGIQAGSDTRVLIYQLESVIKFAGLLTDENIEVLKTYLKADLLWSFGSTLTDEFISVFDNFNQVAYGAEEALPYKRRAINRTLQMMGEYIGQVYIEKHFSADVKHDVEQMIARFIAVYRDTLTQNTWLSNETKATALKKLDTMNVKIGYPDEWNDILGGADMGDSLFESVCTVNRAAYAEMLAEQSNPPNRDEWFMNVYDINAYYNPQYNEIVFPAAILQAPFYDPEASREANLGGIGAVIAHEISHAFDNSGAKYDENGNAVNWWTEADYAEFEKRCQAVTEFYDGLEIAPGIASDGTLTLGENIADFEGVICALTVAKQDPDADIKAFFEQYAIIWRSARSREITQYYNVADVHANPRVRTNRSLQNVADFYEVYGITEGDSMYVPAERRVKIW